MIDPVESLGRLLLSLGVIVGALLLVRRWAQRGRRAVGGPGVRVLARSTLSRSAVVAVVETDGRRFLIGAGDQGVRLLTELEADSDLSVNTNGSTTDGGAQAPALDRPGTGLRSPVSEREEAGSVLDRLRAMTVRTHVDRPIRVPLR